MSRCQMCRMKPNAEILPPHRGTYLTTFRQSIMPPLGPRRRRAMFFRVCAGVITFVLLNYVAPFFESGYLHSSASSAPLPAQNSARASGGVVNEDFVLAGAPGGELDAAPSWISTNRAELGGTFGAQNQQQLPGWYRRIGGLDAAPETTHQSRLPVSTSLAAPRAAPGIVLPANLLVLEQELRAALNKINPLGWKIVIGPASRSAPLFGPVARISSLQNLNRNGAQNLSAQNLPAGTFGESGESGDLQRKSLNGMEGAVQASPNVSSVEPINAYDSTGLSSGEALAGKMEPVVRNISPAVAPANGHVGVAPFDHILRERVRKAVHQVLDDIVALSRLQQLVSDGHRRLQYYLQAEQRLKQLITCLATSGAQYDEHAEGRSGHQPDAAQCAGFEEPHDEDERRGRLSAVEKELNDVQQAAARTSRMLSFLVSRSGLDTTSQGYTLPPLTWPIQQLLTAVTASADGLHGMHVVDASKDAQTGGAPPTKAVAQTLLHTSQPKSDKGAKTGLAPRSLANAPALRGHTLFTREGGPQPSSAPVSFASSWSRPSASTALYAPRHAYHCFKRVSEGHPHGNVLTCECRQSPEITSQDATFLEPVICSRQRRSAVRPRLPLMDQALDCYPTSYEASPPPLPSQKLVRAEYTAVQPRQTLMTTEPPLHCQCFKPRTQYECRPAVPRIVHKESIRVVPEVIEHRPLEPILAPPECELVQRPELCAIPPPVPEPVLVPCDCIEHSVHVAEPYYPWHEAEVYPSHREPFLIPMECILRSTQVERVPCECIARPTTHEFAQYVRPSSQDYTSFTECYCPRDDHCAYSVPVYTPYE